MGSDRLGQILALPPLKPRLLSAVGVLWALAPCPGKPPSPTEPLVPKPQILPHPQGLRKVHGSLPTGEARATTISESLSNVYGTAAPWGSRWFAGPVWGEELSSKEIFSIGVFIEFVNNWRPVLEEPGQPALRC